MNDESDSTPITAEGAQGAEFSSILDQAAEGALAAPSVYNTQPWRWRVHGGVLDLSADRDRQLAATDPDGRMLAISCGIGLHYALVTLAALGVEAEVTRLPDESQPDLLARISPTSQFPPAPKQLLRYQSTKVRHSDRRPFNDDPVSAADVDALRHAAESHGIHLHTLGADQIVALTVTASFAAKAEFTDSALRAERTTWTHRPPGSGDGVPSETTVADVPRKVPVRPLAPDLGPTLSAGEGTDRSTLYTVFFTDSDDVWAWLRAGEALGEALLLAVELGLVASVMSDLVEIPASRGALRRILSGIGHPQIAARFGHADAATAIPAAPRRGHDETVIVEHVDE